MQIPVYRGSWPATVVLTSTKYKLCPFCSRTLYPEYRPKKYILSLLLEPLEYCVVENPHLNCGKARHSPTSHVQLGLKWSGDWHEDAYIWTSSVAEARDPLLANVSISHVKLRRRLALALSMSRIQLCCLVNQFVDWGDYHMKSGEHGLFFQAFYLSNILEALCPWLGSCCCITTSTCVPRESAVGHDAAHEGMYFVVALLCTD